MNSARNLLVTIALLFQFPLISQVSNSSVPLPIFDVFEGTVYEMPKLEKRNGKLKSFKIQEYYSDTIYTYPVIGPITLEKLNVPETYVKEGRFPGVDRRTKFAMILNSKMEVQLDACYEFKLTSDDGSRMWIDEIQIVMNDGGHGMKTKKDTVGLRKGNYDVKVWYFQGMPDRFGLKMDTKIIGKIETCSDQSLDSKLTFKKIVFENLYFDTDKYSIKPEGHEEIKKIAEIINSSKCSNIKIIGHTDGLGTEQYNKTLSTNRANAVTVAIQKLIENKEIEFISIGQGEAEPIDDNTTSTGRKRNRRVEIYLNQ